jgi:hypothetical protein
MRDLTIIDLLEDSFANIVNQTLIRLIKDGKEIGSFWAVGSIVRPYAGEAVENEVIFELDTIPEECRVWDVGHSYVSVKTPEGIFNYFLKLVPEGYYDEWKKNFPKVPKINDALIRMFSGLTKVVEDEEIKIALESFCFNLIPDSETFEYELERLSELALRQPLWFVEVFKYEPGDERILNMQSWIELSNSDYKREYFLATAERKIELRPLGNFNYDLFSLLKHKIKKGFVFYLVLTPEEFKLRFYFFGEEYLAISKFLDDEQIYKSIPADGTPVRMLLRSLIQTPPPFIEVLTFEDELLAENWSLLKNILLNL